MKRYITITMIGLILSSISISAQGNSDSVQTLIGTDNYSSGGFGGFVAKIGSIDGKASWLFGGRGGWVINKTFVLGGGGYGIADFNMHSNNFTPDTSIAFGYGGLELEYLINSNSLLHATALLHIGGGGFTVVRRYQSGMDDWDNNTLYSVGCFVLEPAINAEVNILSWMRLQAGVGYRFVTGIDATIGNKHYTNSTVSGVFGVMMIKFGPY